MPYDEVSQVLGLQEATSRKLVSRALADGTVATLASLLADDVRLCADGGGRVPTLREVLVGERRS